MCQSEWRWVWEYMVCLVCARHWLAHYCDCMATVTCPDCNTENLIPRDDAN